VKEIDSGKLSSIAEITNVRKNICTTGPCPICKHLAVEKKLPETDLRPSASATKKISFYDTDTR
jgi:hypothetical protein